MTKNNNEVKWVSQKQLANKFAVTSNEMGVFLTKIGVKFPYGKVSVEAEENNLAKDFGESTYTLHTYKWNDNLITDLLMEQLGLRLATKEEKEETRRKERAKKLTRNLIDTFDTFEINPKHVISVMFHSQIGIDKENHYYISYIKEYVEQSFNLKKRNTRRYEDVLTFCNHYLNNKDKINQEL